jgi:transposase
VTATARKIAVLFYNTLRYGMSYRDPGAEYYEQQYRSRVLANLQRRAKSLGFVLQAIPGTPIRLFLRKSIAIFAGTRT